MPPASNNVCVTADLNASKDNSFSAMNCLLADGYNPVTQGDPRRPASPQSPCAGTGARGALAVPGASPQHPAAAPAARPLSKLCSVPAGIFGGEGLGNPPEPTLGAACWPRGWEISPVLPKTCPCPERGGRCRCRFPIPCPALGQGPSRRLRSCWERAPNPTANGPACTRMAMCVCARRGPRLMKCAAFQAFRDIYV